METVNQLVLDYFSWKWVILGTGAIGIILIKRHTGGKKCPSDADISGKTVIITGANSGIGKATALELAKRKARVILACRSVYSANAAVKELRSQTSDGELVAHELDLSSLESIQNFADDVIKSEKHIDILINNAGIYQCPFEKTKDGFEMQMGVNHLGHFYLTNLLIDKLKEAAPSRIIVVSSGLHRLGQIDFENLNSEKEYDKRLGYRNSKLANNLFARELSKRLDDTGISVFCLKPGMVRTNLGRHVHFPPLMKFLLWPLWWLMVKSSYAGCQTVVFCAVAEELKGTTGKYYANCEELPWTDVSLDNAVASRLWDVSAKLTGLK